MLECVVNISEGIRGDVIEEIAAAGGTALLDVHSDPWHHRSVVTLAGTDVLRAAQDVTSAAFRLLDLANHEGVHPRLGVVDVVPFVPIGTAELREAVDLAPALDARQAFGAWAASALELPCFFYGPERTLPSVRRTAFTSLQPDLGPRIPHAHAGATCVGARPPLVAYNLWLEQDNLELARRIAGEIRRAEVRALGLAVGDRVQVSCNLVDPLRVGPGEVFDAVQALAPIERAELVGLIPEAVLDREPAEQWDRLNLEAGRTIERRLAAASR